MPSKFLSDSAPDAAPAPQVDVTEPPLVEPGETKVSTSSTGGSTKIHAALTRSSTGHADLRELESGLDSLQSDAVRKARIDWSRVLLPVAALVVLVLIWQFYVSLGVKRRDQVPGPMDVLGQFGTLWAEGSLQEAVWTSLQRGLVGFLISVAIATPIGLLLAQVAPLRRAFGPLISGLQVLPSVAWVPAAIIWFGLTDATVYFVVFMGAIPSIINGLISGVDQIPPQYRSVGTVLGASRLQMAIQIILPAALPGYLERPQAGLGLLLAVAHGRGNHRGGRHHRLRPRLHAEPGPRPRRHDHRDVRDPADPRRGHPDRTARLRARLRSACSSRRGLLAGSTR